MLNVKTASEIKLSQTETLHNDHMDVLIHIYHSEGGLHSRWQQDLDDL